MSFSSSFFLILNWRTRGRNRFYMGVWYQWGRGGGGEMPKEGEYGTNTMYTSMLMEKWYLL
jgi:hypothetical protein